LIKGMTGPPAMPVPRVTDLSFPRSVSPVLETAARACAGDGFSGQVGLLHGCSLFNATLLRRSLMKNRQSSR
jgi:hypothetical protein